MTKRSCIYSCIARDFSLPSALWSLLHCWYPVIENISLLDCTVTPFPKSKSLHCASFCSPIALWCYFPLHVHIFSLHIIGLLNRDVNPFPGNLLLSWLNAVGWSWLDLLCDIGLQKSCDLHRVLNANGRVWCLFIFCSMTSQITNAIAMDIAPRSWCSAAPRCNRDAKHMRPKNCVAPFPLESSPELIVSSATSLIKTSSSWWAKSVNFFKNSRGKSFSCFMGREEDWILWIINEYGDFCKIWKRPRILSSQNPTCTN